MDRERFERDVIVEKDSGIERDVIVEKDSGKEKDRIAERSGSTRWVRCSGNDTIIQIDRTG